MAATGVETRILEAMNARLAALTLSPVVPIAWPNLSYVPSGAYLRPWLLPARADAMTIALEGANDFGGVYQVSVFWPVGAGATAALECASAVAAHFKRGTRLERDGVTVSVDTPPLIGPMIQEPDTLHLPVSVTYRAFVPNP